MASHWRARDVAMLLLLCAAGTALAVIMYILFDTNEKQVADQSFETLFTAQSIAFQSFFTMRLLTLRSIADSLAAFPEMPSPATTNMVLRSFTKILAESSGIGVMARVDVDDVPQWEANQTARWGFPVKMFNLSFTGSVNRSDLWLVSDVYSVSLRPTSIGLDLSAQPEVREALDIMTADIANNTLSTIAPSALVPSFGNEVVITRLARFFGTAFPGFEVLTTVYFADMSYVVTVASIVDPYFRQAFNVSNQTVISIEDHLGGSVVRGTCSLDSAFTIFKVPVPITTTSTWTMRMGQCPSFRERYVTWRRWVSIAIIIVVTLMALELYRRIVKKSWMEADQLQDKAQKQTYSMIVGYVCHEVRNPLHVVKSSFDAVCGALTEAVAAGFTPSEFSVPDQQALVSDGYNALSQMQCTVDDVLDLQAMTNGVFQLTPGPVLLSQSMLLTLRRCRTYLSDDIRFSYSLPGPQVAVRVDMLRLSQVVTNALSNAGKHVCQMGTVDVDVRVVPRASQAGTPVGSPHAAAFLVVTVSNSRLDADRITAPENLFIPFKTKRKTTSKSSDHASSSSWNGVAAAPEYVKLMTSAWLANRPTVQAIRNRAIGSAGEPGRGEDRVVGELPITGHRHGSRVTTSTGLGLPLCRCFAHAEGGWVGLSDAPASDGASVVSVSVEGGQLREEVDPHALGMTQFWAVMSVQMCDPGEVPASTPAVAISEEVEELPNTPSDAASISAVPLGAANGDAVQLAAEGAGISPERVHVRVPDSETTSVATPAPVAGDLVSPASVASHGAAASAPAPRSAFPDLRVLFVDDEVSNRRIGQRFLNQLGIPPAHVVFLNDGTAAFEFLNDPERNKSVGIAFLDILMPGLTGIQVLENLQEPPALPVVAMTGSVEEETVLSMKRVKFSGCVAKPFTKHDLLVAIHQGLAGAGWFFQNGSSSK